LLVTSFVLVATVVVTSASYWYTHFLRRSPGRTFLYGQALFDVGLITTVVHITGGPQSDLTPLYVPLIAATAVLMPPARTGIVTVDQAGHLLYCNPAAEQIFGFKERQWRGRPIMPEFAKIAPEFWAAITATARRGVRAMRVEAVVRRPDRTFPIGVTTTTL